MTVTTDSSLETFEERAQALLDAYQTGTPEALERHYRLTWHRRAWPALRTYVQLDLGKRPSAPGEDVDITIDDARFLIAREHEFADWRALTQSLSVTPAGVAPMAAPVSVRASANEDADVIVTTRDWNAALAALETHEGAALDARGQMTDEMLRDLAGIPHLTTLALGNSKAITDDGIQHLARLPQLRVLDLSGTGITDRGFASLAALPNLEELSLVMTAVTDDGASALRELPNLRRLNVMWTRTGDGVIQALAGHAHFTHLWSGNHVTNAGLAALHELPVFATHRANANASPYARDEMPNQLVMRGTFDDEGIDLLGDLDGLFGLSVDDAALTITARAMQSLARLPNLGSLSVDAKDDWMPHIAAMPSLRFFSSQDTVAGDEGFVALSASRSIERIWGRRCHNLRTRGFVALSRMPSLRDLAVSCLNVGTDGLAALPDFPSLRELMPMDIPDAGYRHIAKCQDLEALTLMYCRDTTDAATEHITGLRKLKRYFNSYTTITDRTPQLLSTMDSLERITFDACHLLTDDGVASLARLPNLRELRVSGRALTPAVSTRFPARVTVRYAM